MSLWRMILTAVNLVGLRFGGAAIGLVSQILLARLLLPAEVGVVFMGLSAASLISLLMTAGYPPLTMTLLPRYYTLGRNTLVKAVHRTVWREWLKATAVLALVILAAWAWLPLNDGLRMALLFGLIMSPAASLIRVSSSVANSQRRFTLSYVPDFLFRPGLLMIFLLAAWAAGTRPPVDGVLWAAVAITTGVALVQTIVLGRAALPDSLRAGRHDLAPRLRGRAYSLVVVNGVAAAFADIVTRVGGLVLHPSEVAELGIAIRLAAIAGFVIQATQNFVLPDLLAAVTRGERQTARTLLFRINIISLTAIGGCTLGAIFFGPLFLSIFGDQYHGAHWPLVLFMVSQLFRAAGGMNHHLLSIDGYQARSASSCIFALAVLVAGASLLAPRLGVTGLAIAVLVADLCWAAALGFQAQRYSGFRGDILALMRHRAAPAE